MQSTTVVVVAAAATTTTSSSSAMKTWNVGKFAHRFMLSMNRGHASAIVIDILTDVNR